MENDFLLGNWLVRPHTNTLEGPGGEAHLEPKAMQVLALLAGRPGEVVSKREILKDVWDGTYVSEEVLPNAIWELRKTLGDDARKPSFIQTLPKKGYRLIAPVSLPAEPTPRAWRHGPAPKLLAALALVAAIALGVFLRGGSSTGASTSIAKQGPQSVLVLLFDTQIDGAELQWLATGVPTMLRTGLAEVPGLEVVSAERLQRVRAELGEDGSRKELARRTGADVLLVGSIFKLGDAYRIDVQVEGAKDSRIVAAHSVRGSDVFALMDRLTLWVQDSLRAEPVRDAAVPAIQDMTTSSLEAFRLYAAGVTARRNFRLADARELLTQAVAIDPSFALAYLELQWLAQFGKDSAAYDRFHQKLLEHEDRLPPHRRRLIEAMALWKDDREGAESILLDVLAQRPDEEEAYLQLSYLYQSSYEIDAARDILERGVRALPQSGYLRLNYGYQLLKHGRYPDAIRQLEAYAQIQPEEANPWDSLGEAYLVAGLPERALDEYGHALEIDESFASAHVGRSWAFSQLGRFDEALDGLTRIDEERSSVYSPAEILFLKAHLLSRAGRYREAESRLQEADALARDLDSATLAGTVRLFRAFLYIEKGDLAGSIEEAAAAKELIPDGAGKLSRYLKRLAELFLGTAAARSGDPGQAHEHLTALQGMYEPRDPLETWWYHLLLGETLLAQGDARGAAAAFTKGEPTTKMSFNMTHLLPSLGGGLSFRDGIARAKALAGDTDEAIRRYEKLLRPDIALIWTAPLEPRYELALARLHRKRGERKPASGHYRRFLELWSKADREIPELAEAEGFVTSSRSEQSRLAISASASRWPSRDSPRPRSSRLDGRHPQR